MSVILNKEGEDVVQQRKPASPNRLVIRRLTLERKIRGNHMTQATAGFYNRRCGWHMNRQHRMRMTISDTTVAKFTIFLFFNP